MNQVIWQDWIRRFEWILEIAKRRNWDYVDLKVNPPIQVHTINSIEETLGIIYPEEFKEILTNYSSGLFLKWQIKGEETEGEFREIFCGGGRGYLWDYSILIAEYKNYRDWVRECFPNVEDDYDEIWHNKIPFINVPNGDVIAFGQKTKNGHPVIYLSHEGDEFHGSKLGENFIDFINKWSNLGCVGTEDWQFEPFYDFDHNQLKFTGGIIDAWKNWLEQP